VYRRCQRIASHEWLWKYSPIARQMRNPWGRFPKFTLLVSALPQAQREVLTMMKVGGPSLEEVARATSSSSCQTESPSRLKEPAQTARDRPGRQVKRRRR
jgi:hypothetical protein